jgi:hypothetical protein
MLKLQYVRWRWPSWMEVRVTGHIFENWPHKDHPCHVCFKLAYWFQRRRFLNVFPIGYYVRWRRPSWFKVRVTGHNFESWPPKDHSCHVCFKLTYWFQRRRLLNIFFIGSHVKIKLSHGGHLEFPISKWFTSLVQDHPMIIPAVTIQLAYWFLTRRFLKFRPIRTHYGPWQPCWISDQRQKQKSCIWPSNEHSCQVWFKSFFVVSEKKMKMWNSHRVQC